MFRTSGKCNFLSEDTSGRGMDFYVHLARPGSRVTLLLLQRHLETNLMDLSSWLDGDFFHDVYSILPLSNDRNVSLFTDLILLSISIPFFLPDRRSTVSANELRNMLSEYTESSLEFAPLSASLKCYSALVMVI